MRNISDKVLKQIEENNIKPKPRWHFLTKNYFVWSMFGISVILGSFAFSIVLFIIKQLDWDIHNYVGDSILRNVFISLPYLWIIFLILFLGVAYYNFIHTKRGYRFKFISISLISLIISIVLGITLYTSGYSENLEKIFSQKIPYYHKLVYTCEKQWMRPEKGLLAGIITEIELTENSFILKDLNNNLWKVDFYQTIWKGKLFPSPNLKIKIIGKITDKNYFKAIEIRPWQAQGGFMKNIK